ncbi:MAG: PRC-barrel domain containing protein [Acidimicrobiia bacterium]
MYTDIWTYRTTMPPTTAGIQGFAVEALDGSIGHVDGSTNEAGTGYLVVDTGPWIFGTKVLIPGGAIVDVDLVDERVYLDLTKEQIKNAPEYLPDADPDETYLGRLGTYYEPMFGRRS